MKKKIKDLTLKDLTKIYHLWSTPLDLLICGGVEDFLKENGECEVEVDKYTYIHSPTDQHLICVETHEKVYVDYPTALEIANIPGIVGVREREAIERYESNND